MAPAQKLANQSETGSGLGGHLRENGMLLALLAIVAFFTIVLKYPGILGLQAG